MNSIIISLYSSYKSIENAHLSIQSLLNQDTNYKYSILLFIYSDQNEPIDIPYEITHLSKIHHTQFKYYITYENIGGFNKLLPLFQLSIQNHPVIIVARDDRIYFPDSINKFIKTFNRYKSKYIISSQGRIRVHYKLLDYFEEFHELIPDTLKEKLIHIKENAEICENISKQLSFQSKLIRFLTFFDDSDLVMYPSSILDNIFINDKSLIEVYCPFYEDLWFKFCCLIADLETIVLQDKVCQSKKDKTVTTSSYLTYMERLSDKLL